MKFTRSAITEDLPGSQTESAELDSNLSPVGDLKDKVIEVLRSIYDPEIPVNIYELGLIYNIDIDASNFVKVDMTLTSPACPVAGTLPPEVESKISLIPGVAGASVVLVWEPTWDMSKMTEAARLQLNLM